MKQYIVDETDLVDIGNAIREKKGTTDKIETPNMGDEIRSISSNIGYEVTFQVDGKPYQITSVLDGESVDRVQAPYRATQLCLGWFDETDTKVEFPYIPTKDTTLNAKYKDYGVDCVFFEPFNKKNATALTGQTINYSNNKSTIVNNGYAQSIDLWNNDCIVTTNLVEANVNNYTLSAWVRIENNGIFFVPIALVITRLQKGDAFIFDKGTKCQELLGWSDFSGKRLSTGMNCVNFRHICITKENSIMKVYVDGSLIVQGDSPMGFENELLSINIQKAYISNVRVFNRALTDVEVQELANELK